MRCSCTAPRKAICHTEFKDYYVDIEYNRNDEKIKTIIGKNYEVIQINCDLIIHSRGEIVSKDNLIALEMKKSTANLSDKINDKNRLIALTKDVMTIFGHLTGKHYQNMYVAMNWEYIMKSIDN